VAARDGEIEATTAGTTRRAAIASLVNLGRVPIIVLLGLPADRAFLFGSYLGLDSLKARSPQAFVGTTVGTSVEGRQPESNRRSGLISPSKGFFER